MKAKTILTLIVAAMVLQGCTMTRQAVLTDIKTGARCRDAGFNLLNRTAWVVLPEGIRLDGRIDATTGGGSVGFGIGTAAVGTSLVTVPITTYSGPSQREGWSLLESADHKLRMRIHIVTNDAVTSGGGDAITSDGRHFNVKL
jgi:hypothetical protein